MFNFHDRTAYIASCNSILVFMKEKIIDSDFCRKRFYEIKSQIKRSLLPQILKMFWQMTLSEIKNLLIDLKQLLTKKRIKKINKVLLLLYTRISFYLYFILNKICNKGLNKNMNFCHTQNHMKLFINSTYYQKYYKIYVLFSVPKLTKVYDA
jgi:hypothetical protein